MCSVLCWTLTTGGREAGACHPPLSVVKIHGGSRYWPALLLTGGAATCGVILTNCSWKVTTAEGLAQILSCLGLVTFQDAAHLLVYPQQKRNKGKSLLSILLLLSCMKFHLIYLILLSLSPRYDLKAFCFWPHPSSWEIQVIHFLKRLL